jgi:VCBS repeat-containing protein
VAPKHSGGRTRLPSRLLTLIGTASIACGLLAFSPLGAPAPAAAATATTFTSAPFTIANPGVSSPTISVSGLTGQVIDVDVRLNGVSHAIPDDLDLYVTSPSGQRVLLVSDAGGTNAAANTTWTFDDESTNNPSNSGAFGTGTYHPGVDHDSGGDGDQSGASETELGAFGGEVPNGTWTLTASDDTSNAAAGTVTGGWSVIIETSPYCGLGGNINAGTGIVTTVVVAGAPADLTDVDVVVFGLDSPTPELIDGFITAPNGDIAYLFSDVGGTTAVSDASLQIDDEASGSIPATMRSGTFQVSNVGTPDALPTGMSGSPGSTLSTLDDSSANGTWTIGFIKNPGGAHAFGGFCLDLTSAGSVPVANPVSATTSEDVPVTVTMNGTDADGSPLTYSIVSGPTNGSLGTVSGNSVAYTPNADYNGPDSFTYRVNDGTADSNVATVSITVNPVNDAPVAQAQTVSTPEDTPLDISFGSTDIDGGAPTYSVVDAPDHGSFLSTGPNTGTYTPATDYHGPDSLTFQVSDGNGGTGTAVVAITVGSVNDAPLAGDDSYGTAEDTPLTVDATNGVLADDTDLDSGSLTATLVDDVDHGILALNADGSFTYTPAANYVGVDSFVYSVSDGSLTDEATVTIDVGDTNDPPTTQDIDVTTGEDTPVVFTLPGSDTEDGFGSLAFGILSGPTHGTAVLGSNGQVTYTPDANYHGADSFTFEVTDTDGADASGTVHITVVPVNDAPVAADDSVQTDEDTPLTVPAGIVLANDTDVDGDSLSAVLASGVAHGTLVFNADGSFVYTPDAQFSGADSFTYRAVDGALASEPATISITVNPVNDGPVANADNYSTNEDSALVVAVGAGVLANDTDIDGDPLLSSPVTGPANGSLVLGSDGSFTYTPNANFNGTDSFTYLANDNHGGMSQATVTIQVDAVNDAPTAVDGSFTTPEDTTYPVPPTAAFVDGFDVDGDPLTASLVSGTTHGTIQFFGSGNYIYTPDPGFHGSDSFTFRLTDGGGLSDEGVISITVTPTNDAPTANGDDVAVDEDDDVAITLTGSDGDGDPITFHVVTGPSHGTLTGTAPNLTYLPDADYHGADSFTFVVNDGTVDSVEATVDITVNPTPDTPAAVDDGYATQEDVDLTVLAPGVLSNDTDIDGDSLTVTVVSGPSHGTLTLESDGEFTYDPDVDYVGADQFTYEVSDGDLTDTANVAIDVGGLNDDPVAIGDDIVTDEDTPVTVTDAELLANDDDTDGDALTITSVSDPAHGTVTHAAGEVEYTPDADFHGTDTFTYTISDGHGGSDSATVTVTVTERNDAPVAVDDARTTTEDTAITLTDAALLANDADVDGDSLTITDVSDPAHGTATHAAGEVEYAPDADFHGTDTFTYTVDDGNGGTSTATVTVTVTPVNDAPVAVDDPGFTTVSNAALQGTSVLGNDTDPDGDDLTAVLVSGPANGAVVLNPDGTFTYTPNPGWNGTDTFTYQADDGAGDPQAVTPAALSSVATVTIVVQQQPTPSTTTSTTAPQATSTTAPGVSGTQQEPLARTGFNSSIWQLGLMLVGAGLCTVSFANAARGRMVFARRRSR